MTNKISPRELEVLKLLAKGLSKQEISKRMALSLKTIQNHIDNMREKFDVHDRLNVLRYALINGILTIEDLLRSSHE